MAGREHQTSEDAQAQAQAQEVEQHDDAPPPVRERWGQDPWEMRWGC